MKEIKYNCRTFINNKGQVVIRTRWNSKKYEVGFSVGCSAEPEKWDRENQRARYNTTHKVDGAVIVARDINNRITLFLDFIKESFFQYELSSQMPTTKELKELVNEKLGRNKEELIDSNNLVGEEKTLKQLFEEFLEVSSSERNWTECVYHKYNQAWSHLSSCDPKISLATLTKSKMLALKEWYIKNGYRNRTANKQFIMLKSILRWIDSNGYPIDKGVLNFKTNLTVTKKDVRYLKSKELLHFASFEFPAEKGYLDKARDMFCFMSYTSLRYSDLKSLKYVHLSNGTIEMYTQKTRDRIAIPIIDSAQRILQKYAARETKNGFVFPVPSNQKLNDYLKEAAQLAGLDREVIDTYFIGTKRHEDIYKLHDVISCHDARRTFVCCSLALGITPTVVMRCTGHSDYESMKPYIEVADETQKIEMDKWNRNQYKSDIIESIEKMSPDQLKDIQEYISRLTS